MRRLLAFSLLFAASSAWAPDDQFERDWEACRPIESAAERGACTDRAATAYTERMNAAKAAREKADQAKAAAKRKRDAETAPQRAILAAEYEALMGKLYSQLNYIKVGIEPAGADFALYARHTYLTAHAFEIGPQGPAVSQWVAHHTSALRAARIRQVGIRDGERTSFYKVP